MERRAYKHIFFFFRETVLNHHHAIRFQVVSKAAVFFKKAATMIAIHDQKTLH